MNAPDAIRVLELRLSGVGEGKYNVEGLVDGQPLIRREDEEIDVPFGLLPSIDHDGDYFMATCECGDPGCAGYFDPVLVTHEGELIHWTCEPLGWRFTFEREPYSAEVRRLIDEGRRHLRNESFWFKRDTGHQNIDLFRSESYEQSLPFYWKNDQKNRAEERVRNELWKKQPEELRRRFRWKNLLRLLLYLAFTPILIPIWALLFLWGAVVTLMAQRAARKRRDSGKSGARPKR